MVVSLAIKLLLCSEALQLCLFCVHFQSVTSHPGINAFNADELSAELAAGSLMYTCVSSVYECPALEMILNSSAVYNRNRSGPRIEACRTPNSNSTRSIAVRCLRPAECDRGGTIAALFRKYRTTAAATQSKAALRSRRPSSVTSLRSAAK